MKLRIVFLFTFIALLWIRNSRKLPKKKKKKPTHTPKTHFHGFLISLDVFSFKKKMFLKALGFF